MKQLPSTKPSCALKKVFHFSEKKIMKIINSFLENWLTIM